MPAFQSPAPLYVASNRAIAEPDDLSFRQDVIRGLGARNKSLPAKYLYDAEGSLLFEKITRLPEYYPTRAEREILSEQGAALAAFLPARPIVVEFGSGSSQKFRLLKAALGAVSHYVPVDIAPELLFAEAEALRRDCPDLPVYPVVGDFTAPFDVPRMDGTAPVVGFFPGSTIGNFEAHEAREFLRRAGETLGTGSSLIIGVDLIKDTGILEAAYDDAAGITAAFNLNILRRINRELGGDFNPRFFRHVSFYNAAESRIEMHLESARRQTVRAASVLFHFGEGERIHTENSYKYTVRDFQSLAGSAGWRSQAVLLDSRTYFSLHVLRRNA